MPTFEYKICQVAAKNLIYRKCSECSNSIVFIAQQELVRLEEEVYCPKCKKVVTDYKTGYKLSLTVLDYFYNKLETITLYDQVVEELIGCSSDQFLAHLKRDALLGHRFEDLLVGMYCAIEFSSGSKKGSKKRAKSIRLQYQDSPEIINVLLESRHIITYDSSLL
ncbi:hypothetical protein EDC96DRAFT_525331 [Choanephora cucurbitarum]|nr:hypothetical protein EDC96DRAFT_525331 [Choanephora cucurbitarum]